MEPVRAASWLYGILINDITLSGSIGSAIYTGTAPAGASPPYVLINHLTGRDVMGVGTTRVMTHLIYQVKVVGETQSFVALEAIADRIDVLLHGASGESAGMPGTLGAELLSCVRTGTVSYAEEAEGRPYRHLGGIYELTATNRGPQRPEEPEDPGS